MAHDNDGSSIAGGGAVMTAGDTAATDRATTAGDDQKADAEGAKTGTDD